jgi:8-oxo-dGTP diphosphatase
VKRLVVVGGLIEAPPGRTVRDPKRGELPGAGRYLVARRPDDDRLARCWEFPGGKVEPGEPPPAALRRELREELGVDVEVGDVYAVGHHVEADREILLLVYRCVLRAGEPRCLEVAEWAWLTPAELATLDLPPADRPIVDRLCRA